ncbi:hypothetical protein [Glaciihabitans sp. dw_435]|uniref:hypothetical protein n=1 Tax=Glaciihabitans sp. dw_435 TaxID=2720081 RepID=UPI001BD45831|nr:hypothetical protein [Glaciihabitans sp. dw_435]
MPRSIWKFLSLRGHFVVSLDHVLGCTVTTRPDRRVPVRFRIGGTAAAGLLAGNMISQGRRSWWAHRYGYPALVIDLRSNRYAQLVVDVEDPGATAAAIGAAIEDRSAVGTGRG